mmetsp:Transcript_123626/g.346210  ORF Transcript_123626/g.346210 Transcript_123626/m.346210 type:complete len:339 (+) Transcript_123626:549-1565(+)
MFVTARWSATEPWKSWFCALRSSPACLRLTCISEISLFSSAIAVFNVSISFIRLRCFSSRSFFFCSPTLMESSVSSISFLQDSILAYSSFCCLVSSAIIWSMAFFTLVKASRRARTARDTRAQLLCFRATLAMRIMARCAARSWAAARCAMEPSCKKLLVLLKRSRASSSVKILRVSLMATISWPRTSERFLYSACSCSQSLRMFARNSSSATMAACVASKSFFEEATFLRRSARSCSACSFCSVATWISPSLAARSFWKPTSAANSAFCASARSAANWSCICLSIPKMPPLRELYDFAPAAAPSSSFGFSWSKATRGGKKASPPLRCITPSRAPKMS